MDDDNHRPLQNHAYAKADVLLGDVHVDRINISVVYVATQEGHAPINQVT